MLAVLRQGRTGGDEVGSASAAALTNERRDRVSRSAAVEAAGEVSSGLNSDLVG